MENLKMEGQKSSNTEYVVVCKMERLDGLDVTTEQEDDSIDLTFPKDNFSNAILSDTPELGEQATDPLRPIKTETTVKITRLGTEVKSENEDSSSRGTEGSMKIVKTHVKMERLGETTSSSDSTLPDSPAPKKRRRSKRGTRTVTALACDFCEYKCKHQSVLAMHLRRHTGEKPFICDYCGAKFTRKHDLTSHIRRHTGEKPFRCGRCNARFIRKYDLTAHTKLHTGEKAFPCERCDRKFACKTRYTVHMRSHTGEKPFKCNICRAQFAVKQNYDGHMRSHTGEKPFACDRCDAKFKHKKSLVFHMRTHTGEKPFTCDMCRKKFSAKQYLITHINSHSGFKPFTCRHCGTRNKSKKCLTAHLDKFHRGKNKVKPILGREKKDKH
ncbi:gastrula zinc finger protein XlCGF8.2DB-like isoform X3 [Pararge aegeria]|uniref:gastrula zinc finger protein XlCGF8.2DB-like isoform X3 n=1 Tax=Pararge aegeria TaxID=116150 RepID=UPI0019D0CC3E|nr:gastrula zinc finger protein XlCGF8.2DB-like isoform X3 [Pararge aegeria]